MNRKPSPAQLQALNAVVAHGKGDPQIYMPYADAMRSFEACERRGWLRDCRVPADKTNGYALTEAGEAVRKGLPEPSRLASALSTLMSMPAPERVVPDLTPAKPGWFWCAFDDGVDFEPSQWAAPVGEFLARLGDGPYMVRYAQDMDGTWFGWLPHGGLVEIGEDPKNRIITLSYPTTVAFQRSAVSSQVRITWLGEAIPPAMPDTVESDLTETIAEVEPEPVGKMSGHRYEVYKDKAGEFRVRFKYNSEIIFSTEGYSDVAGARRAIAAIKKHVPGAEVEDRT